MILPGFAEDQKDYLFSQIKLLVKYQEEGQDPTTFRENLSSLEEAGFPLPPEEEWPPLYDDLPYEAQEGLRLFYILPAKVDGMAGYTGRDLSCLGLFFDIYEVPTESRKIITDIILLLISESLQTMAKKIEASRNKK